jgi:dihydroorotase
MQALIRQAKIIDSKSSFNGNVADILVENGVIKNIASKITAKDATIIKGQDLHVSTGWTDVFADYAEPGYEHKETIASGLDAAAAGGFTNVLLAPNTNPVVSTKSVVEFVQQKARGHVVNLYPLGSATQNAEGKNLAEMMDMYHNGAIAFTDGWHPVQNTNLVLKALEYIKAFNGNFIQIPVDEALSTGGLMHEGEVSTAFGMAGIPTISETLILHRDIELLRYTGSRMHITGVSCAESVDMIKKAKKEGLDITCSVTPYHLAFTDQELKGYNSLYKVLPPLRTEADRQALIAGLKDGTIDCIASHHRPQDWDAKEKEFEYAGNGMNIQELAFSIAWQYAGKKVGIERLIDALTVRPASIFNLGNAAIEKGSKAGLTIFSLSGNTNAETYKSKSNNNPFAGKMLDGKVIGIINNNQIHLNT